MDDATYKDESGTATFTKTETDKITSLLSVVGTNLRKVNSSQLNNFNALQASLTGKMVGAQYKTYNNSKVRARQTVTNASAHVEGYLKWVEDKFNVEISKLKTQKSQDKLTERKEEILKEFTRLKSMLVSVTEFQTSVVNAKDIIVNKLNKVKQLAGTFIKTSKGFEVTTPEGYVAIDRISGNAVKLVDRMEFSYNNFTAIKAWDK